MPTCSLLERTLILGTVSSLHEITSPDLLGLRTYTLVRYAKLYPGLEQFLRNVTHDYFRDARH